MSQKLKPQKPITIHKMNSFSKNKKDINTKNEMTYHQNLSITKKLLEKYKPSKNLRLVDNASNTIHDNKAA